MNNNQKFYINGKWVNPISKDILDVTNPANEDIIAQISLGNKEDLDVAVNAAKKSFNSWSTSSVDLRIELLNKLKDIYQSRFDEMTKASSLNFLFGALMKIYPLIELNLHLKRLVVYF